MMHDCNCNHINRDTTWRQARTNQWNSGRHSRSTCCDKANRRRHADFRSWSKNLSKSLSDCQCAEQPGEWSAFLRRSVPASPTVGGAMYVSVPSWRGTASRDCHTCFTFAWLRSAAIASQGTATFLQTEHAPNEEKFARGRESHACSI